MMQSPLVRRASRSAPVSRTVTTERTSPTRQERRQGERVTETLPPVKRSWSFRRVFLPLSCGMLGTLLVIGIGTTLTEYVSDQWQYGNGRISRLETRVGHQDQQTPTEFLAFESNSHVDVIEIPGGDVQQTHVYQLGQVLTQRAGPVVITLSVKDVNGDGLLDLLVTPQDDSSMVLYNTGSTFQTTPPTKG